MSSSSLPAFGPSCPKGGQWYACSTGANFVGCCATNPCSSTCSQGSLRPASFIASKHGTFIDASCPANSNFYTCNSTSPVFLGCCKTGTNPCSSPGSCDGDNLVPATLNSDYEKSQYGAVAGSSNSTSIRPSSTGSSTLATIASVSSTTSPTGTSASAASSAPIQQKDGPPVAAIAGGAAGGAFAIALVIGLLIYYCCHAKKSRRGHEETVVRRESDLAAMGATKVDVQGKGVGGGYDDPPSYMSPNPNDYYGTQAYSDAGRYHQYIPEPQEMPCDTQGTAVVGFSGKPVSHQRNLSELSGETAIRSEMESPHVANTSSPVTPHAGWQASPSPGGNTGSTWTPQQNWQTQAQTGEGNGHGQPQGLGLNGNDMNHRTTTQ